VAAAQAGILPDGCPKTKTPPAQRRREVFLVAGPAQIESRNFHIVLGSAVDP
jgi:hypothetical protein